MDRATHFLCWLCPVIYGTGRYSIKGIGRSTGWIYNVTDPKSKYYGVHFTYGQRPNNFPEKAFKNQEENMKKIIKAEIISAIKSI